ncbi:MAG: hypothetical protein QOF01_54, partial [Thermomicrobiales bacterium]|nr:hypothetical protein [Thermomicrobiales bacterium]
MPPRHRRRRRAHALAVALFLVGLLPLTAPTAARQDAVPVAGHPRLWITADDLPRLRSWATDANPFWRDGLAVLAETAKAEMDAGALPDDDPGDYVAGNSEAFAELFAFLSLIHPDEAAGQDYAQRARTLLMSMVTEAANGPAAGEPFRDPQFATSGRSRWWGEGFALTVDWIYPTLSAQDKETIRRVFLRWAEEIATTGYPDGLQNLTPNSAQTLDRGLMRWAGNNYFTAGMRNIGLMAMAFDPADDPDGALAAHLEHAIGARLRVVDELLRTDAAGGLAPEGFEYSPQTLAYIAQFLLALDTAGQDDPTRWGSQVDWRDNPFWDKLLPAYLHSLSPAPLVQPEAGVHAYLPAWYGDGQEYLAPDMIGVLGPLALLDARMGDPARLDAIRWIQTHLPPGGAEELVTERVGNAYVFRDAILYFLLFDPAAPPPRDPRPGLPLSHFAPGLGRLFARTSWAEDATWFTYALGWIGIDHQHAEGNQFEFYRNGEWLTKERTG